MPNVNKTAVIVWQPFSGIMVPYDEYRPGDKTAYLLVSDHERIVNRVCKWRVDGKYGFYVTECGDRTCVTRDKFCASCGGRVELVE